VTDRSRGIQLETTNHSQEDEDRLRYLYQLNLAIDSFIPAFANSIRLKP